jgi:hypothetical protein
MAGDTLMSKASQVYVIKDGGHTIPMNRVHCKDEDKELQRLLYNNPELLPGDQIRPSSPRRWLLIKREMPVQDPGTGGDRWNVDFFFADQNAVPTFVECKRFLDTRARREVIGQMLEYAANGQYYWTKDVIRQMATQTAKERGVDIETAIRLLEPENIDDADRFFETVENNLREGQIRLIFFLEEAPPELRSIVEFLNKQMERSEILIVEAKQYEHDGLRVIAPSLFGYTEQARLIKKTVTVTTARQWNEEEFFSEIRRKISEQEAATIRKFYDFCRSRGLGIKWGKGQVTGSLNIAAQNLFPKSIIQITSEGILCINFGWLKGDDAVERARDEFAAAVRDQLGFKIPSNYRDKFPTYSSSVWTVKEGQLEQLIEACFGGSNQPIQQQITPIQQ